MSKKKTPTFIGSITSIFKNIENIFLFYAYFPRDVTVFAYSNRSKGIFRDETRINIYIRRRFSSQLVFPFFQTGKSLRYPFCVPSWWTDVLCLRNGTKKIMGFFCSIFFSFRILVKYLFEVTSLSICSGVNLKMENLCK